MGQDDRPGHCVSPALMTADEARKGHVVPGLRRQDQLPLLERLGGYRTLTGHGRPRSDRPIGHVGHDPTTPALVGRRKRNREGKDSHRIG